MNFLKKNLIIVSCILIVLSCFCLIRNGIASFSYPKGGVSTILILGIVIGTNLIFSKINKRFGDRYTRRLDRIFVHIAVPAVIFTSFGLFQKMQIKNAEEEMQSIIENRILGKTEERKNYDQMTYGELTPILQMRNDRDLIQAEKEKEYLNGLNNILEMIRPENLCDKPSRHENKKKLDTLLQGVKKYKAWMHSEIALREEKLKKFKKLECQDNVLHLFRSFSQTSLSLNDELMDSYSELILSTNEMIRFVEKHQKNLRLINEKMEWDKEGLNEDFIVACYAILDNVNLVAAVAKKQSTYEKQMLEEIKSM